MSEVPFDPDNIPQADADTESLKIEKFEDFDAKELETGEAAVVEAPKGGELYMEGLGPCIGMVGYDQDRKVLFAEHFLSTSPTIDQEILEVLQRLRSNGI